SNRVECRARLHAIYHARERLRQSSVASVGIPIDAMSSAHAHAPADVARGCLAALAACVRRSHWRHIHHAQPPQTPRARAPKARKRQLHAIAWRGVVELGHHELACVAVANELQSCTISQADEYALFANSAATSGM
ncbi:MAG: hypothetical protein EBX69_11875, partial [Betaproteobacteria bacterium]|nr:hypothetical protein [Betaproteobacteria bacterium]